MTNLSSFIYPEETDKLNKIPVEDAESKQVDMKENPIDGTTMVNVDVANDDSNIIQTATESTDVEKNTTDEKAESNYKQDDTHIMQDTIMMTIEGDLIAKPESPEKEELTTDLTTMKPGEQLRYLREQKRFSAQQIADRLYLSLYIIQGIEADDYQHLPPSIFVRGYFRNYAKLLEIPVEPLLDAYTNLTGSKSLPPLTPQIKQKEQSKSSDSWVKAVTFTIVIVSMALMALWRIYPNINESDGETKEPANAELGEAVALPLQPFTPIALSEQPTDTNGDFMPPLEGSTEGDDVTSVLPLVGIPVDSTKTSEQVGVQPTTETTVETPAAPVDPRSMILHYQYESWTRVVDKNDKKVYEGIPKAGESISVKGEPPFKARFGVIEGISVEYKGAKTSLTDYDNLNGRSVTIGEAIVE